MIYKLCEIILKSVEKRKFNKVKDAFTDLIEGKIHRFELNKGDIITVAEKNFSNDFYKYLQLYKYLQWFSTIKREKLIVWYKPSTWFRWYWVLEV